MRLAVFKKCVLELFETNDRLLVFLRYPYSGNRSFLFLENGVEFEQLLTFCKPKDSITVFKSIKILSSGLIDNAFINQCAAQISENDFEEELIVISEVENTIEKKMNCEWSGAENREKLVKALNEYTGQNTIILADPGFCDEENTYHLYFPDQWGNCKSAGAY